MLLSIHQAVLEVAEIQSDTILLLWLLSIAPMLLVVVFADRAIPFH